jgi:hypothetical protein
LDGGDDALAMKVDVFLPLSCSATVDDSGTLTLVLLENGLQHGK